MRHNKKFNHLGRTASHRNAMLANMACSLIKHKRITTTVAKAKALKKFVEPLITKSKNDTTNSRRVVFSNLQDKYAVTELFKEISVKIADRPGGYTRIIKTGNRLGDNAEMCFIELVDYNPRLLQLRRQLVLAVLRNLLLLQLLQLRRLLLKKLLLKKQRLNKLTILSRYIYEAASCDRVQLFFVCTWGIASCWFDELCHYFHVLSYFSWISGISIETVF